MGCCYSNETMAAPVENPSKETARPSTLQHRPPGVSLASKHHSRATSWTSSQTGRLRPESASPGSMSRTMEVDDMLEEKSGIYSNVAEMENAAMDGNMEAIVAVARFHERSVPPNFEKAFNYYKMASESGDHYGTFKLGYFHETGKFTSKSLNKAMEFYLSAANAGHARSMARVGLFYEKGWATNQDFDMAVHWFQESANGGDSEGMYLLGQCHAKGAGVPIDPEEAAFWYNKSAELNYPRGLYSLGYCYETGNGVERSLSKAAKNYSEAARQRDVNSLFRLGLFYENGKLFEANVQKATKFYKQAEKLGSTEATARLEALNLKSGAGGRLGRRMMPTV